MKKSIITRTLLLAMMAAATGNAMAKDIYVSPTGNDTNDGTTAANAVATFAKALDLAASNDVIKFTGEMKLDQTVNITKNVTIEGTGDDRTENIINGQNQVRCVTINEDASLKVALKNLTLRNGFVTSTEEAACMGGAVWNKRATLTIEDCDIYNNGTRRKNNSTDSGSGAGDKGGAIFQYAGTLTVKNTNISDNSSYLGGGIYAIYAKLDLYGVAIEGNTTGDDDTSVTKPEGARGGGAYFNNSEVKMEYCSFNGNAAAGQAGAFYLLTNQANKPFDMNCCEVVGNTAGSETVGGMHGGAMGIFVYAANKVNFRSTTFAHNCSSGAGGVMFKGGDVAGAEINFVNCTITKNKTLSNVGNCGGLSMSTYRNAVVNIINTIVEGNTDVNGSPSDMVTGSGASNLSSSINLYNSVLGHEWLPSGVSASTLKCTNSLTETTPNAQSTELQSAIVPEMDCEGKCFPLQAGSWGTTNGDLALAKQYGCTVDQKGTEMTKSYIGAVQVLDGEDIPETPTAISTVKVGGEGGFTFSVDGGKLSLEADGNAVAEVYNMSGQKLADLLAGDTRTLPRGVYIVKVTAAGSTRTRTIIVR